MPARPDAVPAGAPLYEVRGVVKRHRLGRVAIEALRGVDLSMAAGEAVALAGPSGSGKTTLLNLLGCLDVADEGSVLFEGRDLGSTTSRERTLLRRARLGFVFQTFNLIPVLSAFENVEYPAWIAGRPRAERRRRTAEVLEQVGMRDRARHRPDQLSGGERQRVALARALVNRPAVILADEPTANLDSATGGAILDLLLELNSRDGTSLLLATHDPELLDRVPRVLRLRDGRIDGADDGAPGGDP